MMDGPPSPRGAVTARSSTPSPPRARTLGAAALALLAAGGFAAPASAQLRRDPAVQPVGGVAAGDYLVGMGFGWGSGWSSRLSGLSGDLWSIGRLTLAWAPADRVVVEIRGTIQDVLLIDARDRSFVDLDPGVEDGKTHDWGDYRIAFAMAPIGRREGLSLGGSFEVTLPTTDERAGIGSNTTDVRLGLLGSYGSGPFRLTVDLGLAILESAHRRFDQNDALAYRSEVSALIGTGRSRVGLGLDGHASTRTTASVGTEDVGEVRGWGELWFGSWVLDGEAAVGYAERSPDFSLRAGVSFMRR